MQMRRTQLNTIQERPPQGDIAILMGDLYAMSTILRSVVDLGVLSWVCDKAGIDIGLERDHHLVICFRLRIAHAFSRMLMLDPLSLALSAPENRPWW